MLDRTDDYELLASEIQDKTADDVARYYPVFKKKWKELSEYLRIKARIEEGEAKRNKRSNLEALLAKKIASVRYPMQELELNYPTTKGKVYSEEEDRYLLCRLNYYGMQAEDVYERIKKDISEFPVFRFDWFFKSRSPQELQRRCNTLLGMIEKEQEGKQVEEVKPRGTKGKVRVLVRARRPHRPNTRIFCRNEALSKFRRQRRRTRPDHRHQGARRRLHQASGSRRSGRRDVLPALCLRHLSFGNCRLAFRLHRIPSSVCSPLSVHVESVFTYYMSGRSGPCSFGHVILSELSV